VYSIVLPYREEPLLQWTIDNVLREVPDAEIIAIEDEPMIGIGVRRDQGIRKAKHQTVFLLDAHMGFSEGFFHGLADVLAENPKRILCSVCKSLSPDLTAGPVHGRGAYLVERDSRKPYVSKWNQSDDQPGSVLGGAYCLNKDWYIDGLNAPWRYHRFWGKSEQIIAITNWIMGGENLVVHDHWASHLFKKTREVNSSVLWNVKLNAWFILHCLADDQARKRIMGQCYGKNLATDYGAKTLNDMGAIKDMRGFIGNNGVRSYSSFPFISLPKQRG
jgi:hypothetical protein